MKLNVIVVLLALLGCSFVRAAETNWTVVVLGQVQRPGTHRVEPGTSIFSAIDQAGGFTRLANITKVEVRRKDGDSQTNRVVLNLQSVFEGKQKFELRNNDVIKIPERIF
jgi:protein involved in polysaccharide export with SLBB domain